MKDDFYLIEPRQKATEATEKREVVRHRVYKGATIQAGSISRNCIVKNLSDGGAKLALETTHDLPEAFQLRVSDGKLYKCEVRWRTFKEIGVMFMPNDAEC